MRKKTKIEFEPAPPPEAATDATSTPGGERKCRVSREQRLKMEITRWKTRILGDQKRIAKATDELLGIAISREREAKELRRFFDAPNPIVPAEDIDKSGIGT